MSQKDYYQILGVTKSSNTSEIKKAYLDLAKKYHPDRNKGDKEAERRFKEISAAYDILKDEQKKAAYDQLGHDAFQAGGGSSYNRSSAGGFQGQGMNDIFGDFFNDFMGGSSRRQQSPTHIKGSDLKYNLSISLEEAFTGIDRQISFSTDVKCNPCEGKGSADKSSNIGCSTCGGIGVVRRQQGFFAIEQTCHTCNGAGTVIKNPCTNCHGSGRHAKQKNLLINIPAGVEDNNRIRIVGEGEAGIRGGSSGDLYVFVTIKPHNIYHVDGSDLHFKLPLSFPQAVLGDEIEIPVIDGSKVKLKIPAGTENNDKIKLSGKGMSKVRSTMRGDLYAHAYIQTPKKLSAKQKELIESLGEELGRPNSSSYAKDSGLFSKMKNIWS